MVLGGLGREDPRRHNTSLSDEKDDVDGSDADWREAAVPWGKDFSQLLQHFLVSQTNKSRTLLSST